MLTLAGNIDIASKQTTVCEAYKIFIMLLPFGTASEENSKL